MRFIRKSARISIGKLRGECWKQTGFRTQNRNPFLRNSERDAFHLVIGREVRVSRGPRGIWYFPQSSSEPREEFDLIGYEVAFPRKRQLYIEGESSTYLYRIVNGVARSYRIAAEGRRQIVAFHVPGDLFGFEVGDTHALSAEAVTDVRVRFVMLASLLHIASCDDDVAQILQLGRAALARVASFLLEMVRRMPSADAVALSLAVLYPHLAPFGLIRKMWPILIGSVRIYG